MPDKRVTDISMIWHIQQQIVACNEWGEGVGYYLAELADFFWEVHFMKIRFSLRMIRPGSLFENMAVR